MEEGAVAPGVAIVTEECGTARSEVPNQGETVKKHPSQPLPPFTPQSPTGASHWLMSIRNQPTGEQGLEYVRVSFVDLE